MQAILPCPRGTRNICYEYVMGISHERHSISIIQQLGRVLNSLSKQQKHIKASHYWYIARGIGEYIYIGRRLFPQ